MKNKQKVFILPGFSIKNKDWAEEVQEALSRDFETEISYWPHWKIDHKEEDWVDNEAIKIRGSITEPVNIIAKSIGTVVAMKILQNEPKLINKLTLCGIPLHDLGSGEEVIYNEMIKLDPEQILIIQNETDTHGLFTEVKELINTINPEIKLLSKPRSDHEYPYTKEFISFLTGSYMRNYSKLSNLGS